MSDLGDEVNNGNGNGRDHVTFKFGPASADFRGRHLPNLMRFLILVGLVMILVAIYLNWREGTREHESMLKTLTSYTAAIQALESSQRDASAEASYMMTQTPEQLRGFNLSMPDSLRRRIRQ